MLIPSEGAGQASGDEGTLHQQIGASPWSHRSQRGP